MRSFTLFAALLAVPLWASADLYVSGFNSGGVYRFNESTGAAVGGGVFIAPQAGLSLPHGVMRLADGTFIIASAGTDQVRRYTGAGVFHSVFIANGQNGMPANTLDYPVDFALGPDGDLFITSQLNDRIIRCDSTTGAFIGVFVNPGTVDGPSGLAWDAANTSLYAVARFGNVTVRYDTAGAAAAGFSALAFNQPFGVAIHPTSGELFVVNGGANNIRRLNSLTGATLSTISGGLGFPIGIRFGPAGDLYVANFGNDRISRFDGATFAAEADLVTATTAAAVGLDGPNFFNFIPNFTALEQWRIQHFQTSANSGAAANLANPDNDQLNNLLEFATGRTPTDPDASVVNISAAQATAQFTYPRNTIATDDGWNFTVEWSDTLTESDWHTTSVTESVIATSGSVQTVQAEFPAGPSVRRNARLRVWK